MSEKSPQPTKKLIERMRRHARMIQTSIDEATRDGEDWTALKVEALRAIVNIHWQAAGRLEDLTEARQLLEQIAHPHHMDDHAIRMKIEEFLKKTEGLE